MKTLEPVAVINSAVTIVEAAIALGVGFGLRWTPEQVGLVMAFVLAVGNLIKTLWARAQVSPTASLGYAPRGLEPNQPLRQVRKSCSVA